MKTITTSKGTYRIGCEFLSGSALSDSPQEVQNIISPGILGYLRANTEHDSPLMRLLATTTLTNLDVFYGRDDKNKPQVILVKDGGITRIEELATEIKLAYENRRKIAIPEKILGKVHDILERKLEEGQAQIVRCGDYNIPVNRLTDEPLTRFIFSDTNLQISPQDYQKWITKKGATNYVLSFGNEAYLLKQKKPFVTRFKLDNIGGFYAASGGTDMIGSGTIKISLKEI
jgi:hypothetical protein